MIILIGGSSCTGKTLFAHQLMERYKVPYFSVDYLKMGLFRSNESCGFTPVDELNVIAEKLWPIVREMIKTYIENKQDMIIEGCYILPQFMDDFSDEYKKQINAVYLGFSDDYIVNNFQKCIVGYRNVIEDRGEIEDRPIERFKNEHNILKRECEEYDADYYEVTNDYEVEMEVLRCRIEGFLRATVDGIT